MGGPRAKWTTPPVGWYKANWNVALDKHIGWVGIGVVVRDSKGMIIAARNLTQFGTIN